MSAEPTYTLAEAQRILDRVKALADECAANPDRLVPNWAIAGDIRRAMERRP